MKHPASREVLDPLIDWADVVVENFSPGTMEKLGLDYPRLAARNPGLVMASGSVFGQTGPLAQELGRRWHRRGLERPHAADRLAGSRSRDSERRALRRCHRAIRDGRECHRRARQAPQTGHGCHIDASMYELCVQQMRAAYVRGGADAARSGNTEPGVFHQGVYATQGADRWIAITFDSAAAWTDLRKRPWSAGT